MNARKFWTQKEKDEFCALYTTHGPTFCAEKFNRTVGSIRRKAYYLGLEYSGIPLKYQKDSLFILVKESTSFTEVVRKLNMGLSHGNRQTILKYIKKYELDISHFVGGYKKTRNNVRYSNIEDVLIENSPIDRGSLKKRLLKAGLKKSVCEECGQDENWRGKKISIQLDHVNGYNTDNRIENLRMLCPNCHSATETYSNRNNNSYVKEIPNKGRKPVMKDACPNCGNEKHQTSNLCIPCDHIRQRRVQRPSIEDLRKDVQLLGYEASGRKYGVSGVTIKKWMTS